MSYELPRLRCSLANPQETDAQDTTAHYLQIQSRKQCGLIASYCEYNANRRNNPSVERKRKKTKFCGEIIVSKQNKPTFSRIVHKFKKSFQPANASNVTSERNGRKQVGRGEEVRQTVRQRESRQEMRRLSILSRVIAENTRRQILSRREKFHCRRIST